MNKQIPEENSSRDCKTAMYPIIIVAIVVALLAFTGGLYFGETNVFSFFNNNNVSQVVNVKHVDKKVDEKVKKGSYEDGYNAGLALARKKLGVPEDRVVQQLSNVVVKSISGNDIVVEFNASVLDIFADGKVTRTVKLSDESSIERHESKSMDEVKKEYEEFEKKMKALQKRSENGEGVDDEMHEFAFPTSYTVKKMKIGELKVGDVVTVASEADISKSDVFEAKTVVLNVSHSVPVDVAPVDSVEVSEDVVSAVDSVEVSEDVVPSDVEELPLDEDTENPS